jgi:hypothetical protein
VQRTIYFAKVQPSLTFDLEVSNAADSRGKEASNFVRKRPYFLPYRGELWHASTLK